MTGSGRPLRFLLLVMGGWTGARLWLLWPSVPTLPAPIRSATPPVRLAAHGQVVAPASSVSRHPSHVPLASARVRDPMRPARATAGSGGGAASLSAPASAPALVALGEAAALRFGDPVPAARLSRRSSRLTGSAWLLVRDGPALAGGLAGAQLGGSQAGVRLAYAVDKARRLAIVGRLSAAIGGSEASRFISDREGAIGLAWRPTRLPVTLVAEQRFVFEQAGHGGPTVGVIAGLPPTAIAARFRLEAYGQAGAIARSGAGNGMEGFGDGAARLARPFRLGAVRLDAGAGAWGGAQRGAARLDIGPTVGATMPVAGHALRLAADWRQRIAGNARPGSGPALSLGIDF